MHVLMYGWYRAMHDDLQDNIADTAEYLLYRGHRVTLVCPSGPFVQRMVNLGATVRETDYENRERFLATGALEGSYDLIHAHAGPARIWGLEAREKLGIPYFVTFYCDDMDSIEKYWQHCSGIFAVSPAVRQKILETAPQALDRIHDMPNTVISSSRSRVRRRPAKAALPARVLVASRFDRDKREFTELLLEVLRLQARREEGAIRWEIAGTGPELERVKAAAQELSDIVGREAVHFHGRLDDEKLAHLESACHASVSSGRSALASLARGMPTIAPASRGCFGLVTRDNFWAAARCNFGEFGLDESMPPSDMLDILQDLIFSSADRREDMTDCSDLAHSYFSRNLWGDRMLAHYVRAVAGSSARTPAAPFMPPEEVEHLTRTYAGAKVILEYGSGGSIEIAARMPGKYIMSVESDLAWARDLRQKLTAPEILSPAVIYHADIGETGPWGRPLNDRAWRDFYLYPTGIWDQPWFRHPDVVLIDGRFRTACLATILLRAERPVRVLFDDYGVRLLYRQVEEIIKPVRMVGRMAEFHIEPGLVKQRDIGFLIRQFFWVSLHGICEEDYQVSDPGQIPMLNQMNDR